MADDQVSAAVHVTPAPAPDDPAHGALLEEFSILELEERLEFALCCDGGCSHNQNCACPGHN